MGGNWDEEDLKNYDGYQNRGLIKDLWQEAFDCDATADSKFEEFLELLHQHEEYDKIIEEMNKVSDDVVNCLKKDGDNDLGILQTTWLSSDNADKTTMYDSIMSREELRRWLVYNGTTVYY